MKHITDKAEISVDFPDKTYLGSFTRNSSFEAMTDAEGVVVKLVRGGEGRRVVGIHLHWFLFADILDQVAEAIEADHPIDSLHHDAVKAAAARLAKAARARAKD